MIVSCVSNEDNGGGILRIVAAEAVAMCVVIIVAMSMSLAVTIAVTLGVVVQRME